MNYLELDLNSKFVTHDNAFPQGRKSYPNSVCKLSFHFPCLQYLAELDFFTISIIVYSSCKGLRVLSSISLPASFGASCSMVFSATFTSVDLAGVKKSK